MELDIDFHFEQSYIDDCSVVHEMPQQTNMRFKLATLWQQVTKK